MEEKLKVLIVDDEPIARKFLRVCIDWEAAGFTISAEAGGGAEALDLMEVDTPDIVFADIQMPFMDGLTFSRIVAKQYPQVKIVILTAHQTFLPTQKKASASGCRTFCSSRSTATRCRRWLRICVRRSLQKSSIGASSAHSTEGAGKSGISEGKAADGTADPILRCQKSHAKAAHFLSGRYSGAVSGGDFRTV